MNERDAGAGRAAPAVARRAGRLWRAMKVAARRQWRRRDGGETWQGLRHGVLLGLAVLVLVLPAQRPGVPAMLPGAPRQVDLGAEPASADVQALAQWVVDSADNGGRLFAVLDKVAARLYLFETDGRLFAASPVLLGYARGDDTVPGVGDRPIEAVRPFERTTPAGRFVSRPGRNAAGEDVLWVDHAAAVSMHRLRLTDPTERRAERLASASASDRRISYGCINLPPDFFDTVFWPRFGRAPSVVYVLPEVVPLERVFPPLAGRSRPLT
ncbi:MAG: hypothetical protein KIT17_16865 [Rubrivivax sp.]|nr:hypothetical protein [Rubrivivax sp.]